MHRTEGDGFVIETGKNRFKDQALPTYTGTVDTAEYNNAVQEEICNLIELLGGTVEPDAATDRTNGWQQLYDLLLDDENITDAAMFSIDLAKGFGNIATASGLYTLQAVPGEITLHYEAPGADDITVFISTNPTNPGIGISEETTGCTTRLSKGIEFDGGPGEVAYDDKQYRKAGFLMSTAAFFPVDSTVFCDPNHTTDIPTSCQIIGATIYYATSGNQWIAPAMLEIEVDAGFWKVVGVNWTKPAAAPNPLANTFNCIIEYDATSL